MGTDTIYIQVTSTFEGTPFDFRAAFIGISAGIILTDWQQRGRPFVAADDEVIEPESEVEYEPETGEWNVLGERADDAYDTYRLARSRWQS